jgi:hypothetical protein
MIGPADSGRMRVPGVRRSAPLALRRRGVSLRLALHVLVTVATAATTSLPGRAFADSAGEQAFSYTALRADARSCHAYTPQIGPNSAVLYNHTNQSARVSTEVRVLGGGARYVRDLNVGANAIQQLTGQNLGLPGTFKEGSFRANIVQPPSPGTTPSPTPRISTPGPAVLGGEEPPDEPPTAEPTAAPTATAATTETATPTATPTPPPTGSGSLQPPSAVLGHDHGLGGKVLVLGWVSAQSETATPTIPCGLLGVTYQDAPGVDRWAIEAATDDDVSSDIFLPLVHRADAGFNTEIMVQNVGTRDASVTATFKADRGGEFESKGTIRSGASAAIDMRNAPKGLNSVEIAGSSGSRLVAAAYHTGPEGMSASNPGVTGGARRVALPLLFRAAGQENAYTSEIRVMNVSSGAVQPRITFRDRDTDERIGPILATRFDGSPIVLQTGQGYTWLLGEMSELRAGRVYAAEIDSSAGNGIAVVVEHVNMRRWTFAAYSGIPLAGVLPRGLIAPLVANNFDGLNSAIEVQNLNGNNVTVAIRFFDRRGNRVARPNTMQLRPNSSATLYLPDARLPDGFMGRAELVASGEIAAVVNSVRYRADQGGASPTATATRATTAPNPATVRATPQATDSPTPPQSPVFRDNKPTGTPTPILPTAAPSAAAPGWSLPLTLLFGG